MNVILEKYFNRLKEFSSLSGLEYHAFERDSLNSMPFSIHFRFTDRAGVERNSWGSGNNQDEAFGKALLEMIERIYFSAYSPFEYKKMFGLFKNRETLENISKNFDIPIYNLHPSNTNGVALHLSKAKAEKSAMFELLERHTILYSFVKKIGPNKRIEKSIGNKKCVFYAWTQGPCKTSTVVGSYTDEIGSYFSSGCDSTFEKAFIKSEMELNSFLFLKNETAVDATVSKNNIQSINRYHKYSGDRSAISFFESTPPGKLPELNKSLFYTTRLPVPEIFKGLPPLVCVRVIHPDSQQLFFDVWKREYLNPRIYLDNQDLPDFPHIVA